MSHTLTDKNYIDILFTALEHDSSMIIEYFQSKQMEYSITQKLFHYKLFSALEYLKTEYQNKLTELKYKNSELKRLGGKPSITDVQLNPFHYTNKIYNYGSWLVSSITKEHIKVLETALIEYQKTLKQASAKKSTGTQKILESFDSTLTDPQLKILYDELTNGKVKFISETTLKQLTAIFRAEAIEKVKPVKWIENKPQLFYFLNGLIDKKLLGKPENLYKYIDACFVNIKGKQFINYKQSYNTLKNITEFHCRYSDVINEILKKVISI